jgi:peptidoglycan/LPS O-acetylase OafA/YrhL
MFFWLGGFLLASSHPNKRYVERRDFKRFYTGVFVRLYPLYLVSLLCTIVFFLLGCNPATYDGSYHYGRQAVCQATPFAQVKGLGCRV